MATTPVSPSKVAKSSKSSPRRASAKKTISARDLSILTALAENSNVSADLKRALVAAYIKEPAAVKIANELLSRQSTAKKVGMQTGTSQSNRVAKIADHFIGWANYIERDHREQKESLSTRINVNEKWELLYWANRLSTSPDQLKKAVTVAGPQPRALVAYLQKKNKTI